MENVSITVSDTPTLMDGKNKAYLQNVAFTKSIVCGANAVQMSTPGFKCNVLPGGYQFGFTPLHTLLSCGRWLIRMGGHLIIKCHMTRKGSAERAIRDQELERIHDELMNTIGVRVNEPRPNGGTSTTGPVVRRCFTHPAEFAAALRVPEDLIKHLWTMYLCIASRYKVNTQKYREVCQRVTDSFYRFAKDPEDVASFYHIIPSLHQALHWEMMDELPCASGLGSEEGSEKQNQELDKIRTYFSRKASRLLGMKDLFDRLNQKGDEVMQSFLVPKYVKEHEKMRRKNPYPEEYLECLENRDEAFRPIGWINDELYEDNDLESEATEDGEIDLIDDVLEEEFDFAGIDEVQDDQAVSSSQDVNVQADLPMSPERPSSQEFGAQFPDDSDMDTGSPTISPGGLATGLFLLTCLFVASDAFF